MKTHGMSKTRFYGIWNDMMMRCYNPQKERYPRYGGRGIEVDKRWHKFDNFYTDMFPTYRLGLSIERKKVNENYSKSNCIWIEKLAQSMNRERTIFLTVGNVTKRVPEWAAESGTNEYTIYNRIKLGWPHKECVFGNGKRQKFDAERIKAINLLYKQGMSMRKIAIEIGSSHSAVSMYIIT